MRALTAAAVTGILIGLNLLLDAGTISPIEIILSILAGLWAASLMGGDKASSRPKPWNNPMGPKF